MPYYNRDPKRDHNLDNHSYDSYKVLMLRGWGCQNLIIIRLGGGEKRLGFRGLVRGLGFRVRHANSQLDVEQNPNRLGRLRFRVYDFNVM